MPPPRPGPVSPIPQIAKYTKVATACRGSYAQGGRPMCAAAQIHLGYLLDSGVLSTHLIWIVLSSCTLPRWLPDTLAFGMRKVFLCRREQQVLVTPCCEEREGLWLEGRFPVATSMQLSSKTCSSTNSWFCPQR